ncbi:hypothetical protein HY496_00450 [Candidatus Woesearchaeota archaeon]|nr:hypothetical protein [Candidatus Woesearchaeota archaeon]
MGYDLLHLLLPHPAEKAYCRALELVSELAEDTPSEEEIPLFYPTQGMLEVVGQGKGKTVYIHFVDQPFQGSVSKLERICAMPSSTDQEKEEKFILLSTEMEKFEIHLDFMPETLVYEFSVGDGMLLRVSKYEGNFTDPDWRWESERRGFDRSGYELKSNRALIRKGYMRAQQCQEHITRVLQKPTLRLRDQDLYQFYLSAIQPVAEKKAMGRFMASLE